MIENTTKYSKTNPFLSPIKERVYLCPPGSGKNTQHIVLDLKNSDLTYQVGDSVGIIPINDQERVERTLQAIRATGEETIIEKKSTESSNLREFLQKKANLTTISKKFITELCHRQTLENKKNKLERLLQEEHKQELASFLEAHEIWDILLANLEAIFTPQELVNLMMPLMPRFYSIASSQFAVKEEMHLTVAALEYVTNGHVRRGICTNYLLNHVPLNEPMIPIYIQANHGFTLPQDQNAPIIMVGPGTGVAPFRAFMQQRVETGATGKNWLFFGERNRDHHFFYKDYWHDLESQGKLRLDVAFSRDQEHKVYVQDRLLENAGDIFNWLEDGAYFYVCGDAQRMAKDVDAALHHIIKEKGNFDEEATKAYVKKLRADKRYLRDVY